MKRIPKQLIKDYILIDLAYASMLTILQFAYSGNYDISYSSLMLLVLQLGILFTVLLVGEVFTTYVLRSPFSYSDDIATRFLHFLKGTLICLPLLTAIQNQLFVFYKFGIENWIFAWTYYDGSFSLKWFWKIMPPCAVASFFTQMIGMTALSEVRAMRNSLRELSSINQMLEAEQEKLLSRPAAEAQTEKIVLQGDGSKEKLILCPMNIMYVESVGNYLNIVYLNDSELCQMRMRSSLKEIEDTLKQYPYLIHIHRAFLVNINFITQVSGNASGYKISLFSTDRVLPVSKANVAAFRNKINELGRDI